MNLENVTIDTLNGGEVTDLLELGLKDLLLNIDDPNSLAKSKRKLTLTVTFSPSDDRTSAVVNADCKVALAPRASQGSYVYLEKEDGERVMKGKKKEVDLFEALENQEAPTKLHAVNKK